MVSLASLEIGEPYGMRIYPIFWIDAEKSARKRNFFSNFDPPKFSQKLFELELSGWHRCNKQISALSHPERLSSVSSWFYTHGHFLKILPIYLCFSKLFKFFARSWKLSRTRQWYSGPFMMKFRPIECHNSFFFASSSFGENWQNVELYLILKCIKSDKIQLAFFGLLWAC